MNKTQLFYIALIVVSFRFGIEYNLYLVSQFNKYYHLYDLIDFIIFFLYLMFFPSLFGFALISLYQSLKEDCWIEPPLSIGRRGSGKYPIPSMIDGHIFIDEQIEEERKGKYLVDWELILSGKSENPLVCWNCESKSESDSIFCMTCGIELKLNIKSTEMN